MSFVANLKVAADEAAAAETQFRRSAAQRIAALEQERSFAFRRLNLVRAVTDAMVGAEDEDAAVACAAAALRTRLDLGGEAEAAVLAQFAPVASRIYASLAPEGEPCIAEAATALEAFESWYVAAYGRPFWMLFEIHMVETPLVDF